MREYFYQTIMQCFGNAIYQVYGSVEIALFNADEGKKIRFIAYDLPSDEIVKLTNEEQQKHIQIDKIYDISDVDFDDNLSVMQKINNLVTSFEIEVY